VCFLFTMLHDYRYFPSFFLPTLPSCFPCASSSPYYLICYFPPVPPAFHVLPLHHTT
jgi:hypothetical protein